MPYLCAWIGVIELDTSNAGIRKGQPKSVKIKKGCPVSSPFGIDRPFADSIDRTFASREVGFEITGEEFERAFDRRTGHSDQITKSFAFVEGENLAELFKDRLAALPAGLSSSSSPAYWFPCGTPDTGRRTRRRKIRRC